MRPAGERYGLWRGNDWSGPRIRLGHLDSCVEQAVAMVDFTSRNGVTLHTAAEDIHGAIGAHRFRDRDDGADARRSVGAAGALVPLLAERPAWPVSVPGRGPDSRAGLTEWGANRGASTVDGFR